jgi:hypothetical protein
MVAFIAITQFIFTVFSPAAIRDTVYVKKTDDFAITGAGDNASWKKTDWQLFTKIDKGGENYESRSKVLYSEKGLYVLFTGEDRRITTKEYKDDDDIYEGDVFELFLKTDIYAPHYFEYEINPLGRQLILMLSGLPHNNLAWSPWRHEYEHHPLVQRKVVTDSKVVLKAGSPIRTWTAELFFPYELLGMLPAVPPKSGDWWSGNFCRIDYDSGKMVQWSWSKKIKKDFHELENFGYIRFE